MRYQTQYAMFPLFPFCYVKERASSARRILKRGGGGGQELQKILEEQRSESENVPPKISPIFRPKLGEEQKKRVFAQI